MLVIISIHVKTETVTKNMTTESLLITILVITINTIMGSRLGNFLMARNGVQECRECETHTRFNITFATLAKLTNIVFIIHYYCFSVMTHLMITRIYTKLFNVEQI